MSCCCGSFLVVFGIRPHIILKVKPRPARGLCGHCLRGMIITCKCRRLRFARKLHPSPPSNARCRAGVALRGRTAARSAIRQEGEEMRGGGLSEGVVAARGAAARRTRQRGLRQDRWLRKWLGASNDDQVGSSRAFTRTSGSSLGCRSSPRRRASARGPPGSSRRLRPLRRHLQLLRVAPPPSPTAPPPARQRQPAGPRTQTRAWLTSRAPCARGQGGVSAATPRCCRTAGFPAGAAAPRRLAQQFASRAIARRASCAPPRRGTSPARARSQSGLPRCPA